MKNELIKLIKHYESAVAYGNECIRKLQTKTIGRDEHAEIRSCIKERMVYQEVISDLKRILGYNDSSA